MKRILITGASGLLGISLVDALSEEYEVVPTHNREAVHRNSVKMDICDDNAVLRVVERTHPDAVIHAAAETNVDKCETDKTWAWNVNALGTRNVAEACAKISAKLIYISTDYVFDGDKGAYSEEDESNPINHYGVTKLKGEEFVRALHPEFVIARTSVIYGWHPKTSNFATWVIDSLANRRQISVVDDQYNSPTLSNDLSEILRRMLLQGARGIYHTVGSDRVSRYDFALKIAEVFGLDGSFVKPAKMTDMNSWIARRPKDSSLRVDKLQKELDIRPLSLNESLKEMSKMRRLTR